MSRSSGRRQPRRPGAPPAIDASPEPYSAPWLAAALVTTAVWLLYVLTLAPSTQFWDTSEYIAAGHIVGIPHAPGNPLFVLLARAWELLLAPTGLAVAVRTNLFSATASALAHGFWFLVLHRALSASKAGRRIALHGAAAGVILSATAFTVWNQSNVNEKVYTISLLTTALLSWLMLVWRDRRAGVARPARAAAPVRVDTRNGATMVAPARSVPADRLLVLAAFLLALTATNHMMGLLVAPAMLVFVLATYPRALANPRVWLFAGIAALVGLSVFAFLPVRGALHPLINEGDPTTWTGFLENVQRKQYAKPSVLVNPVLPYLPRTASLIAAQFANWAQYFDWQWARSVAGTASWFGGIRPLITLAVLLLGIAGARTLWRSDRASALQLLVLFFTLSVGLTFYLNFRYGFTYPLSASLASIPDVREVRERDYFFLIGFSIWGLFSGVGIASLWSAARERIRERLTRGAAATSPAWRGRMAPLLAAPVLALALAPAALNWSWASRADDYSARDWAYNALMSVDPYGVLFTNGDNDTFPLWYLQEVEGVRRDVAIVVTSYLNTTWYAKQVRDSTRPCPEGVDPDADPTRIVCQRPYEPPPGAVAVATPVRPPGDSVLPLTDAQIEAVAGRFTRLDRPARLAVGNIGTTVPAGTDLTPSDTFITAMLAANLGKRPIHFIVPSPRLAKLNLMDFTVRHGLTFRLENGPVRSGPGTGVVEIPGDPAPYTLGHYVDLAGTESLVKDTFVVRRRPEDRKVWADTATKNIPLYYAFTHAALAQAWAVRGDSTNAVLHADRSRAWAALSQ